MVSFDLSEDQKILRETIAAFAGEQLRPLAREADESLEVPDDVVSRGWELGLVQSAIPEAHGGFGDERSAVTGAIALEELAWGDLSLSMHLLAPRLLVYPMVAWGTDEQKKEILPKFTGESFHVGTAAVVEPSMHFDLSEIGTTWKKANGDAVLSGRKAFVPLAGDAETLLVYARRADATTTGNPLDGYAAVDAFLVPRDAGGLTVSAPEKNMGIKALRTHELVLDDVKVPIANRLGGEDGIDFAVEMNRARVALAAMAVGVARAAFEYARDYAKERKAFGVFIAQKQAIAFLLADMAIEIDATRLLVWEAAWKLDRGEDATREAYLAKNYAADMVLKVCDNALQVLGGHGYIRDHLVELFLRNARGFASFEGMATV